MSVYVIHKYPTDMNLTNDLKLHYLKDETKHDNSLKYVSNHLNSIHHILHD
jgi:hypothetical protein